jgi:hypothetical protein
VFAIAAATALVPLALLPLVDARRARAAYETFS